jgi:hypothetical protein
MPHPILRRVWVSLLLPVLVDADFAYRSAKAAAPPKTNIPGPLEGTRDASPYSSADMGFTSLASLSRH